MRWWVRLTACFCLSLMLWTVAAESTHQHPNQTESASCLICVTAHSANPTPHAIDTTPAFATVGVLQEEDVVANPRLAFSHLGNRGPPAL